jgi:hypothetical protein
MLPATAFGTACAACRSVLQGTPDAVGGTSHERDKRRDLKECPIRMIKVEHQDAAAGLA